MKWRLGTPTLAILICLPPLWSYYSLQRAARLRALHFEQDYTALLLTLASSIKTGLDPLQALTQAHEYFHAESSVRCELLKLKNNLEAGMAEEHVINDFASTIDHPDINLFRIAFVLSRKEGSSLAECLRRLVRVTRQRQSFRRKIKAAVATQKLSANGIAVCAVFIAAVQISSNYKAMVQAYNHPVGFKILFGGVVVILLGVYLLRRMANTQFES